MFKPGVSGNPKGRPEGSQNKSSTAIRKAYQELIEGNLDNVKLWLERVAKEDPAKALTLLIQLSPFVIPKLNQTDITSNGDPFNIILPNKPNDSKETTE